MKLKLSENRYPLATFATLAAISIVLSAGTFAGIKEHYRSDANDPQIEAAQEITEYINDGAPLDAIVDINRTTDIENSLSVIVMVFDKDSKLVASSAKIGEETPEPPSNVFNKAKETGENRFTWEPKEGVQMASVLRQANDDKGFVLVARSLSETNNRIMDIAKIIGATLLLSILLSALLTWLLTKMLRGTTNIALVEENITVNTTPLTETSDEV